MSSGPRVTAGGAWPANCSSSPAMSSAPSQAIRSTPANIRGSLRVWYSSSDVVMTVRTSVPGTTFDATSR